MIAAQKINDTMSNESSKLKGSECLNEQSINEGCAKTGSSEASDNYEPQKNLRQKKPRKFLLLSNLMMKPAGPVDSDVHHDITDADSANRNFAITIEDNESDDVPLDTLFNQRKGGHVTPRSHSTLKKNKGKRVQVEELRVGKKLKPGSEDCHENRLILGSRSSSGKNSKGEQHMQSEKKRKRSSASKPGVEDSHRNPMELGSKSSSTKTSNGESDLQSKKKRKESSAEVRPSSSQNQSCLETGESSFKMQEDPLISSGNKSKKYMKAQADITATEASEAANEDSEMEAVKLLASHFTEEDNPSRPSQSITRENPQVAHLVGSYKCIDPITTVSNHQKRASPFSSLQNNCDSNGNRSVDSKHGQRDAKVYVLSKNAETACACVQKKIKECSTQSNKGPVISAKAHNKLTTRKVVKAFYDGRCGKLDKLVLPPTGSMGCRFAMKAAEEAHATQRTCETLECSLNQNPAEFITANGRNKFMRGG